MYFNFVFLISTIVCIFHKKIRSVDNIERPDNLQRADNRRSSVRVK